MGSCYLFTEYKELKSKKDFLQDTIKDLGSSINAKMDLIYKHGRRLSPKRKQEILQEVYRLENRMTFFRVSFLIDKV